MRKSVLVSPHDSALFVEGARIDPTEGNLPYADAVLAVANDLDCPVVDMNRLTRELFERLGKRSSDWIQPLGDVTHFTPAGAKRIAATLASELVDVEPSLNRYLLPDAWCLLDQLPAGPSRCHPLQHRRLARLAHIEKEHVLDILDDARFCRVEELAILQIDLIDRLSGRPTK